MNLRRIVVALILAGAACSAQASTVYTAQLKCPIGGESFEARLAGSGTQFGVRLDLRPMGPIISPWPVAVCPGNGFVMFKDDFTPAELKTLTRFIDTPMFKSAVKTDSAYYRVYLLQRALNPDDRMLAWSLVQATWEVENDARFERYAREAIAALDAHVGNDNFGLVAADLRRRLGLFDEALEHVDAWLAEPMMGENVKLAFQQERAWILKRDRKPQMFEKPE